MGYWWPPGIRSYNPAPRTLAWHLENGVMIPDEEDRILFGIGTPAEFGDGTISGFGGHPLAQHETAGKYHGTNPGVARTFLKFWKGKQIKSDEKLLENYHKLIAQRAPGDPPRGGLAADSVDENGTVRVNYWDMADDNQPQRKQVFFRPVKDGVEMGVAAWNADAQQWGDEGFDFERDFTGAIRPILEGINIVSTAIVSIFATPAAGAAWYAAFSAGLHLSDKQRAGKLTLEDALGESFGAMAQMGLSMGAGEVLASEGSKLFSSGLYKSIGIKLAKLKKEYGDFAASLQAVAKEVGPLIPKLHGLSVSSVLEGAIPPEILDHGADASKWAGKPAEQIPGTLANEWAIAVAGFAALQVGDLDKFYSWRKLAEPSLFDPAIAMLIASSDAEQASLAWQARTFMESRAEQLTFRQALARSKQIVQPAGAVDAPKTWRQSAAALGLSPDLITVNGTTPAAPAPSIPLVLGGAALGLGLLWIAYKAVR